MKHIFLFCFVTGIAFLFYSCDVCSCKKIVCPPFENAHFSSWFPYNNDQTTVFKNGSGDADTISFLAIQKSASYEASRGCYGSSGGCNTDASIYASAKFSNNNSEQISINFTEYSEQSKRISLYFGSFKIVSDDIVSEGLKNISSLNYTANFYPQLNINNIAFANVQVIMKDTVSKQSGIYKLFLSRNNGIVAYEQYPSLTTWIKQ